MPGVVPKFTTGPVTRKVFSAVTGGMAIQARTDGLVEKAAAGSVKFLGVAMNDAAPAASGEGTTSYGAPVLDISLPPAEVAVARQCSIKVTYTLAAAYGQRLICAANGQVTPAAVPAADASAVIGYCDEPAGVGAGAVGTAYIF